MSDRARIDFSTIPWTEPLPGARVKRVERGGRTLRLVEFTSELREPDWCRRAHRGWVIEGRLELRFPDRVEVLGPGDGLFIGGGEADRHVASVREGVVRLVLVEEE